MENLIILDSPQADSKLLPLKDEGFTLPELLIVLIVIGIIAGISILSCGGTRKNSYATTCKSEYQTLLLAIQGYQADNAGALPPSIQSLAPTYVNPGLLDFSHFALSLQAFPGISSVFSLPVSNTGTTSTPPTAFVRNAILTTLTPGAGVNGSMTFNMADTSSLVNGMSVVGLPSSSLFPSFFTTNASAASGANQIYLDDASGVSVGMPVSGSGLPTGATVASIIPATSTTNVSFTLANAATTNGTLSNSGVIFGALPVISNVTNTSITVTSSQAFSTIVPGITSPSVGTSYSLVLYPSTFNGLVAGTAPTSCSGIL